MGLTMTKSIQIAVILTCFQYSELRSPPPYCKCVSAASCDQADGVVDDDLFKLFMTGRVPEFCPGDGVQCCNVSGILKSLFGPLKQSTQDEDLSGTSLVSSKFKALKPEYMGVLPLPDDLPLVNEKDDTVNADSQLNKVLLLLQTRLLQEAAQVSNADAVFVKDVPTDSAVTNDLSQGELDSVYSDVISPIRVVGPNPLYISRVDVTDEQRADASVHAEDKVLLSNTEREEQIRSVLNVLKERLSLIE